MIKSDNRKHYVVMLSMLFLCILLVVCFSGCEQVKQNNSSNATVENSKTNNDQLHSFVIPKSLMGNKDIGDIVKEYNDNSTTVLMKSGEEVPIKEVFHEIYANNDGTGTYVFTSDQLENYLSFTYQTASLSRFISRKSNEYLEGTSIKSTEFPSDDLSEIIVYVDSSAYDNTGEDGVLAHIYTTTYMGLYQVMRGVDPYEWRVHVTVKDYKTGDMIEEGDYPIDR